MSAGPPSTTTPCGSWQDLCKFRYDVRYLRYWATECSMCRTSRTSAFAGQRRGSHAQGGCTRACATDGTGRDVHRRYFRDMDRLNVVRPDISPRASGHIPEMIELIETLVARESRTRSTGRFISTSAVRGIWQAVGPPGGGTAGRTRVECWRKNGPSRLCPVEACRAGTYHALE